MLDKEADENDLHTAGPGTAADLKTREADGGDWGVETGVWNRVAGGDRGKVAVVKCVGKQIRR